MKRWPILTVALDHESDVVSVRQKARRVATLLGFAVQDQTRIATAVSEIARNAHAYGDRGRAEFLLEGRRSPESLVISISDRGPGIADVDAVLEGRFESQGEGLGLGVAGARRLMDAFAIESRPGEGANVAMGKRLPSNGAPLTPERLADLSRLLAADAAGDPMAELRAQNQELLHSLEALETRQLEAARLTEELERTNKGVVALYAELDLKAVELQELNGTLEQRVAEGVAERARIQESLRQSQKMEAVGQLTGGVAHDFNNLLMVIGGSLELLRRRVPADPAVTRLLDAASESVARGGALNKQLLAFARRQDLHEEVISVNQLTPSFLHLIERAVSEDIAVEIAMAPEVWHCCADPHQLETAVLNLAINARDAMPEGGVLTLATKNRHIDASTATACEAEPGDYVVVSISDTGIGIAPEVIARVFEPFFTTKEVGRGTGLGLSQVYGFAKQSGGFVVVESEVGRGATVLIHLPRAEPAPTAHVHPHGEAARIRGDASILVVEDDPGVRATTSEMLRDLGYKVFEAATGRTALDLLDERAFDLVFSDVVLPEGLSGVDIAVAVKGAFPETAVLLTSGYTAHRLETGRAAGIKVLSKPYNEAELSKAVRAALEPRPFPP